MQNMQQRVSSVSGQVDLTLDRQQIKKFLGNDATKTKNPGNDDNNGFNSETVSLGNAKDLAAESNGSGGIFSGGGGFLSGLFRDKDNVVNIKPFLNLTARLLGINTKLPDVEASQLDPSDPATIAKSMFQVWNPKVRMVRL